jgi:hypothetical protein
MIVTARNQEGRQDDHGYQSRPRDGQRTLLVDAGRSSISTSTSTGLQVLPRSSSTSPFWRRACWRRRSTTYPSSPSAGKSRTSPNRPWCRSSHCLKTSGGNPSGRCCRVPTKSRIGPVSDRTVEALRVDILVSEKPSQETRLTLQLCSPSNSTVHLREVYVFGQVQTSDHMCQCAAPRGHRFGEQPKKVSTPSYVVSEGCCSSAVQNRRSSGWLTTAFCPPRTTAFLCSSRAL